jgi:hypothetical protein
MRGVTGGFGGGGGVWTASSIGGAAVSADGTGVETRGRLGGRRSLTESAAPLVWAMTKAAAKTDASTAAVESSLPVCRRGRTGRRRRLPIGCVLMRSGTSSACR